MIRNVAGITYTLTYKKIKNINLRVRKDLSIVVSAPSLVPLWQIDAFVRSKSDWVHKTQQKLLLQRQKTQETILWTEEECLRLFNRIADEFYPQFSKQIENKPVIKVKHMKNSWGICHPKKNYITLNALLMNRPLSAIEYVIMHEFVHFLHGNHQKGFYEELARRMPDYQERRKLLKGMIEK